MNRDGTLESPLRRDRLYEQVADRLQALILDESLLAGEQLPSERELADRMGVSRTVIREATRVLSVRGLVEVKAGSGTYVKELTSSVASSHIGMLLQARQAPERDFDDLARVRSALEVEIAALAAENAEAQDIAEMEAVIELMAGEIASTEEFVEYDVGFHTALVVATKNEVFALMLAPITDLLVELRRELYRYDSAASVHGALTHHRRILAAVKAGDADGARNAMRNHLDQAGNLEHARQIHAISETGE